MPDFDSWFWLVGSACREYCENKAQEHHVCMIPFSSCSSSKASPSTFFLIAGFSIFFAFSFLVWLC